jgi:hypothetical protein
MEMAILAFYVGGARKNFDKFWTNLELLLINLGRYLPVFRPIFPVFSKTGFLATYRYFFPNEKKKSLVRIP